jgi:branched-chain amino acid aminotransferase
MIETGNIQITKVQESKISQVDFDNLPFGRVFTDHMFVMDYADGKWQKPAIVPFQNLSLHPATSAIHYGQSIFEGMKAYKNDGGDVMFFRPELNVKRMNASCERMCMPEIPEDIFMEALETLVSLDKDWIPTDPSASLYIRPYLFGTDEYIGIKPSDTYKFIIFLCPVGAYYSEPLRVKIETEYTRASQGGVGRAKTAGNYAASLYPAKKGQDEGYHQLVWTDGIEHKYIEESGTMNIVFNINGTIVSPSEDDDTILRGTTKRSVMELAKFWGYPVEERKVTVAEIEAAAKDGSLLEAFGAGTAATIAQIKTIGFASGDVELPEVESREFSNKVFKYLDGLKRGKISDEHNWVNKI